MKRNKQIDNNNADNLIFFFFAADNFFFLACVLDQRFRKMINFDYQCTAAAELIEHLDLGNTIGAPTSEAIKNIVTEGKVNNLFRMILSLLTAELTGKTVPYEKEGGFLPAVNKAVTSVIQSGLLPKPEECEHSAEKRLDLVLFLCREVVTNRAMIFRRYSASVKAGASRGVTAEEALENDGINQLWCALGQVPRSIEALPDAVGSTLIYPGDCAALKPMFDEDMLSAVNRQYAHAALRIFLDEYKTRRQALIERCGETLATLAETQEASTDKVALRQKTALKLSCLTNQPAVGLASIFAVTPVDVASAFEKSCTQTIGFNLRDFRVSNVPDRGGRVNTYNFDTKVTTATKKADDMMRGNRDTANKQKQQSRQAMERDAAQGVGLGAHTGQNANMRDYDAMRAGGQAKWGGRGGK